MALLDKYLKTPSKFSAISAVDFFKNTFINGFIKNMTSSQIRKDATSMFAVKNTKKYDPTK